MGNFKPAILGQVRDAANMPAASTSTQHDFGASNMNVGAEFREISHCGGQIIFHVTRSADGRRGYQITFQGNRPVPMALYSSYALLQGIPVADLDTGGIGSPWPAPPVPGCIPVFIASDSEGNFGFQCQPCK
jgi:hypothetical protein